MIFVEGKPDKVLLSSIGVVNSSIKIAGSKGAVCNQMKKRSSVKGVVDEDPGKACPPYINQLNVLFQDRNIILLEDKANSNKVIVIRPYLEEWVLGFCKSFRIDLKNYFLPSTSSDLKKVINMRLGKFEKLIADNHQIEALQKLKNFVNN
jgi:hypothetical protein